MRRKLDKLRVLDTAEEGVYTDGGRVNNRTAVATITRAEYLGWYATVMDAGVLAVAMGLEIGDTVITDRKAAIGRLKNLKFDCARGWIEWGRMRVLRF